MPDLEIIDAHTHVLRSKEHGAECYRYFLNRSPQAFPDEPVAYGTVPEVLKLMEATGVVHTNFLMFTWSGRYYRDGLYTLPDEPGPREKADKELKARIAERIRGNNEWALSAVKEHKNLSFFCGIDPIAMDEEALLSEIADKTSRGALGVKMVPLDLGIGGNDRRLWPVYDYCQSKELPILSETSGRPGAPGRPAYFADALRDFPRLKLILAHLGHNPIFGEGADTEVIELANAYENVFTDVSLRFPEVADGHVAPEDMVSHLRRIGIDRVMYGSNFLFVELIRQMQHPEPQKEDETLERPQMTETRKSVEVLKMLPLGDDERELIASENFKRVTGLKV
jgi:predicted TIM-barrel fold metal-dependent hydrolase